MSADRAVESSRRHCVGQRRKTRPSDAAPDALRKRLQDDIRVRCEVRVEADVLAPGTLPKTEFKAKRVKDLRQKS